jgi:hypothetical protein
MADKTNISNGFFTTFLTGNIDSKTICI